MPRNQAIITTLAALLVVTNAWWSYRLLDNGISLTYLKSSHETAAAQLAVAKAVVNAVLLEGSTKESVVRAAQIAANGSEPFEKDGALWVGHLGLQFDSVGRLAKVITFSEEAR